MAFFKKVYQAALRRGKQESKTSHSEILTFSTYKWLNSTELKPVNYVQWAIWQFTSLVTSSLT